MQRFRFILIVLLLTGLYASARADFRPRSGEYLIEDLEEAQADARAGSKPLTFILTDPNTTCGRSRGMFDEVRRGLRGRSILVFCNSQDSAWRSKLPPGVADAFLAPESGRFIPKTVVVDVDLNRVLARVPYTGEQRERRRLLRAARSSMAEQTRTPDPGPARAAVPDAPLSRAWTDVHDRRGEGE